MECVVNLSEGCRPAVIERLVEAAGPCLLDVHSDPWHNRSVFTLGGDDVLVAEGARQLARRAVDLLDLGLHSGAHPRLGTVDVVPFVSLEGWPVRDAASDEAARRERDTFATWAAAELGVPVFLYGPERALPDVRRYAWGALRPDRGPEGPHPTAGAMAVGCRPLMVAYNLWLAHADISTGRAIANALRSPLVRALAFTLGEQVQVSCNLLRPLEIGPGEVMDQVSDRAPVARSELVGLVPQLTLEREPQSRWDELDLSPGKTIEARLAGTGCRGPQR